MRDFLEGLLEVAFIWIIVVGGFAALLFTIRLLAWLVDVLLLGGW